MGKGEERGGLRGREGTSVFFAPISGVYTTGGLEMSEKWSRNGKRTQLTCDSNKHHSKRKKRVWEV